MASESHYDSDGFYNPPVRKRPRPDGPHHWCGGSEHDETASLPPSDASETSLSDDEHGEEPRDAPKAALGVRAALACAQAKLDASAQQMPDGTYLELSNALMTVSTSADRCERDIKLDGIASIAAYNPCAVHDMITPEVFQLDGDLVDRVFAIGEGKDRKWWNDLYEAYSAILTEDVHNDLYNDLLSPVGAMNFTRDMLQRFDFKGQKIFCAAFGKSCPLCPFIDEAPRHAVEGFTWDLLVHAPQVIVKIMACTCRPRRRREFSKCSCWMKWAARDAATEAHWADEEFVAAVGPRAE